jgi:hypothetical protein
MPVLNVLFSAYSFLSVHYDARTELETRLNDMTRHPPEQLTIWKYAYIGGEGLYGAYIESDLPTCKQNKAIINKIDELFRKIRAEKYMLKNGKKQVKDADMQSVEQVYESFGTIAFQTGFLMTVDMIAQREYRNDILKATTSIFKKISTVSLNAWLVFFGDFREWYIKGVDPKAWPKYRKMLLTLLGYNQYFKDGEYNAPAVFMIKNRVNELCEGVLEGGGNLGKIKIKTFVDNTINEVNDTYNGIGASLPYSIHILRNIGIQEANITKSEYAS